MNNSNQMPVNITLNRQKAVLTLDYADGFTCDLSCEFLRVFTPSAEARGHAPGQEILQVGKRLVGIDQIVPVGNYAVRLEFSDGHNTGLYSWDMLYEFCQHHDVLWQAYLDKMAKAGKSRDPAPTLSTDPLLTKGCHTGACKK